jgi:glycosyltransferase involved in cell wall biosynthesis
MADVLGGVAAKGLPLKHVCHLRDMRPWMASPHLRDHCRRFIYKALLAGSQTTCIAVSEAVRTYTCESLGWATEKIRVILNGIDTEEFFPAARPERPEVVVGGAGRFIHEKGFEFLIQAVGRLYRQGVPVRLRIAGEGSSRPAYEQLASELNFADRLELVERVTDMPSFYRNLDVFVMPSLEAEGLPRGILEAMASGVATVATATAGAPEVIRDGVNGLLVPAADASSLALAIERLARDPDLRKRLGHEGRNRIVKDFTLDRVYNQVVDQYMKVLHD